LLTFDLGPRLAQITCPVLQLAGEADPIVTIEDSEDLAAALPAHARFERFPNAGHMLAVEDPARVGELIREFVLAA
jgi:pimeloyl-ACP methyl ester carboxylesterase